MKSPRIILVTDGDGEISSCLTHQSILHGTVCRRQEMPYIFTTIGVRGDRSRVDTLSMASQMKIFADMGTWDIETVPSKRIGCALVVYGHAGPFQMLWQYHDYFLPFLSISSYQ